MRNFPHVVLALIVLSGGSARAGGIPATIGYSLYVDGSRVGHSTMKVSRGKDSLRFDSETRVEMGPNLIELRSHTIVDPATYQIREFSFDGTKGGMPASAFVRLEGDSATGWVQNTMSDERRPRAAMNPGGFVVFEDWIMDLEVVLALHQAREREGTSQYVLLFGNSFLTAELLVGFTGEASVESVGRSMVARRMELAMSGATPFISMVDPANGVPVYLHFPGSRTEAFRDDFFGDTPMPRYPVPAEGGSLEPRHNKEP